MVDDTLVLYEMMYIIDSTVGEDGINKAMDRMKSTIVDFGGSIVKDNPWGQRRLAYPIKKRTEGYYVVLEFMLAPSKLKLLNADIRISLDILRHMTLRVPKAKLVQEAHDEKVAKQRAADAHARAAEIAAREAREKPAEPAEKEPAAPSASDDSRKDVQTPQADESHSPVAVNDVNSEDQSKPDLSAAAEAPSESASEQAEAEPSESEPSKE